MENSQPHTFTLNQIAKPQTIIQKIMNYAPPSYLGSHVPPQPLINKFNVEQLTNILDRNKIQSIDKVYRSKEDGFNLLEFVRFFLNVIEHEEIETLYLTIAIIDFFKEISQMCGYRDKLYFIDITNYICNHILEKRYSDNQIQSKYISDYRTIIPSFKIKDYLLYPPKIYSSKDQLVYKLSLNKIKIDKMKHEGVVTSCYFSSTLMKVFTLDDLSDSICVYNTSCVLIKKINPHFSKLKKDIVVLSFAYSERQERIGAVLKDFSINFWDNSDNFQFQKSISTASHCQQYQTNIWFFEYFNSWVTSDKTGHLYIWNLQTEKPERIIKLVSDTQINDLAVIPCINLIAVVQQRKMYFQQKNNYSKKNKDTKEHQSFDLVQKDKESQSPVIYMYDFFKGEVATKIELGSQNRNPHTIQYSQNYQVLLSAGYQKKISIFEINKTFLDTSKKGQLTGHQSLITSFTVLRKSPMVISADDKGKVKIWDIRNYKCVQTLDFRDKTNITKLLDMIQLGKVGVLGSRINFVQFDEKAQIQKKIQTKDKIVPLWIQCDYSTEQLIILTKKDIRVIDMRKGLLKNIYCEFHTQDVQITFFKYFETLQKFIIGNQKGQIKLFSLRTGLLDGRLLEHSGSITHVEYDQQNKIFLTMGQDSTIQIQKQLLGSDKEQQNTINVNKNVLEKKENKNEQNIRSRSLNSRTNKSRVLINNLRQQKQINPVKNLKIENQNPNTLLLRQMKNNFFGRQLTIAAVSVYHGFIAIASNCKTIYIWDYEFSKLLIQINLPKQLQSNVEPTSMQFINGYSILMIGTSEGFVYFVRICRQESGFKINTIGFYRPIKQEPVTHITIDILIKGFNPTKQKFIHCKVYIGHSGGCVSRINLTKKLNKIRQQASAVHKQNFNAQRQLRQNFITELQKKKYQSYTINTQQSNLLLGQIVGTNQINTKRLCSFKQQNNEIDIISFQAHKVGLTGLNIIQLDDSYLASIGLDERVKIWKQDTLVCDWNINLPLPFKWDIQIENEHKKKDKIMFALKIIQQIFQKYGNDISINQAKSLKVRKLLDKIKQQGNQQREQRFITQPITKKRIKQHSSQKIILFQNQFTKKDMHYDILKKFNFNQIGGPTLRQIQVQKKLDLIQKQWSTNKQKVQQDNNKLLNTIRIKAQKNQQKQQILNFMQPKENEQYSYLNTDQSKIREKQNQINKLNQTTYVKNIMWKLDNLTQSKVIKCQILNNQITSTSIFYKNGKQNYSGLSSMQKFKLVNNNQQKVQKNNQKNYQTLQNYIKQKNNELKNNNQIKNKSNRNFGCTFQNYYQQKQKQHQQKSNKIKLQTQCTQKLQYSQFLIKDNENNPTKTINFRNILSRMNDRVKQSKKKKIKIEDMLIDVNFNPNLDLKEDCIKRSSNSNSARHLKIATSDGSRRFRNF